MDEEVRKGNKDLEKRRGVRDRRSGFLEAQGEGSAFACSDLGRQQDGCGPQPRRLTTGSAQAQRSCSCGAESSLRGTGGNRPVRDHQTNPGQNNRGWGGAGMAAGEGAQPLDPVVSGTLRRDRVY